MSSQALRSALNGILSFLLLGLTSAANAQTVAGQITGAVVDSGGAVVAGAQVQVIHETTKQVRQFAAQGKRDFHFPGSRPGCVRSADHA